MVSLLGPSLCSPEAPAAEDDDPEAAVAAAAEPEADILCAARPSSLLFCSLTPIDFFQLIFFSPDRNNRFALISASEGVAGVAGSNWRDLGVLVRVSVLEEGPPDRPRAAP